MEAATELNIWQDKATTVLVNSLVNNLLGKLLAVMKLNGEDSTTTVDLYMQLINPRCECRCVKEITTAISSIPQAYLTSPSVIEAVNYFFWYVKSWLPILDPEAAERCQNDAVIKYLLEWCLTVNGNNKT